MSGAGAIVAVVLLCAFVALTVLDGHGTHSGVGRGGHSAGSSVTHYATMPKLTTTPKIGPAPFSPRLPSVGIAGGMGLAADQTGELDHELNDYVTLHATWVRTDFAWNEIEAKQGVFTWGDFDQLVHAARARNLNMIATIDYTPPWANGGHSDYRHAPSSAIQFGRFAGEVAARYAPMGVHVYEIWNEPNVSYWQPTPNPVAYTADLCAAYSRIHAADPRAIVVTGGASPAANTSSTIAPQTWLEDLYADGARNCFDAVGYHPYVDSVATHDDLGGNWSLMYDNRYLPDNLRALMNAHGDGSKRIWATEVGCSRRALGDAECAQRLAEALGDWKTYGWAAALCWFTYKNPDVYGLVNENGRPRPEYYAFQSAAARYSGS